MGGRFGKQPEGKKVSSSRKEKVKKVVFSAQFDGLAGREDGRHCQSGDESCSQCSQHSSVDSASHDQPSATSNEPTDPESIGGKAREADLLNSDDIPNQEQANDNGGIVLEVKATGDKRPQQEPPYFLEECGYLRYSFKDKVQKRTRSNVPSFTRDNPNMSWYGRLDQFHAHVTEHHSPTPEYCQDVVEKVRNIKPSPDLSFFITKKEVSDVNVKAEPASYKPTNVSRENDQQGGDSTKKTTSSQAPTKNTNQLTTQPTHRNTPKGTISKKDTPALREPNTRTPTKRQASAKPTQQGKPTTTGVDVVKQNFHVNGNEITMHTEVDEFTRLEPPNETDKETDEVQHKVTGRSDTGGPHTNVRVRGGEKPKIHDKQIMELDKARRTSSIKEGATSGFGEDTTKSPLQRPQAAEQGHGPPTTQNCTQKTAIQEGQTNYLDTNREQQQPRTTGTSNQIKIVKCGKPSTKQDCRLKTKTHKEQPRTVEQKNKPSTQHVRNAQTLSPENQKEQTKTLNQRQQMVKHPNLTSVGHLGAETHQKLTPKMENREGQSRSVGQRKQTNCSEDCELSSQQKSRLGHPKLVLDQGVLEAVDEELWSKQCKTSAMGDAGTSKQTRQQTTVRNTETVRRQNSTRQDVTSSESPPLGAVPQQNQGTGKLSYTVEANTRAEHQLQSKLQVTNGTKQQEKHRSQIDEGKLARDANIVSNTGMEMSRDQRATTTPKKRSYAQAVTSYTMSGGMKTATQEQIVSETEWPVLGHPASARAGEASKTTGKQSPAIRKEDRVVDPKDVVPIEKQLLQEKPDHQSQKETKHVELLFEGKQALEVGRVGALDRQFTVVPILDTAECTCHIDDTNTPWQPRPIIVDGDTAGGCYRGYCHPGYCLSSQLRETYRANLRAIEKVNLVYDVNGNIIPPPTLEECLENIRMTFNDKPSSAVSENHSENFAQRESVERNDIDRNVKEDYVPVVEKLEMRDTTHCRDMINQNDVDDGVVATNNDKGESEDPLDAAENNKRVRRRRRVLDEILAENQEEQDECNEKDTRGKTKEVPPTGDVPSHHEKMDGKRENKHDADESPQREKVNRKAEPKDSRIRMPVVEKRPPPCERKGGLPKLAKTKVGRKADKPLAQGHKRTRSHVVFIAGNMRRILRKRPMKPVGKGRPALMDIKFCEGCSDTRQPNGQDLFPCPKCRSAYYCTRECQHGTAKIHKKECPGQKKARLLCKHT